MRRKSRDGTGRASEQPALLLWDSSWERPGRNDKERESESWWTPSPPNFRLRSHLAERVGFRRSAARAASGANPDTNLPDCAPIWQSGGGFRRSAARAASGANPDTNLPDCAPIWQSGGGFRRSAAHAASGANPDSNLPIALPFGGVGGIQALRRARGFGRESRHQSSRLRSHLAEWGGFRRSAAAHAASGANPDSNLPIALPFGGVGGIQALRRSRGFGRESRQQPSDCAPIWRSGGFRRSAAHAASGRPGACAA